MNGAHSLIEDREADAKITLRELRKSGLEFDSSRVSSEAELLRAFHGPVDVILAYDTLLGFNPSRVVAGALALRLLLRGWI